MSHSLTPAKRPFSRGGKESNGKRFHKSPGGDSQKQLLKFSSGGAVFRVLFPASKIGGLIGKGGSIISQIRQETGAKVRVDDAVPGCDERVIFIMGTDKEAETSIEQRKNEEEEEVSNAVEEQNGAEAPGGDEDVGDEESTPTEDVESEKVASAVQKALLMVFEKMIEREEDEDGGNEEGNESSSLSFRLLVLSSQVGCLLGKGGSVVKQMAAESGAQIRVLPRDKLPACASPSDEVVQISGAPDAVKKAVKSASEHIMKNATRERDTFPGNSSAPPHAFNVLPSQGAAYGPGSRDGTDYHSRLPPFLKFQDGFIPNRMNISAEIFSFRLLCPDERVGAIIGKGGAIIKTLQHDTGCEIKVLDGIPDVEDRIIVLSGPVHPDERISPLQEAVLLVQTRIARAISDINDKGVVARFLVSSNQIGCLLGKGGAVIAEMRKVTGAYIRILSKDQIPKCVADNEEVVQVNGELEIVQEAVLQITTRLRHHFFRDMFPSLNLPLDPAFPDLAARLPAFGGRREFSPPRVFRDFGPPFHQFDSVGGPPPLGGFHTNDDLSPFMHDIHRPGFPRIPERPWGPQAMVEGGPVGPLDYTGGSQRRTAGFAGGSQPAIITNTTVEVVVPSSVVPSIYGEGGGCLRQIRQISEAKITITDPKPGAAETVIIISGMPEQTHAAQSLIQAFVISETKS
ncbi:hypothetical protein Dimus_027920 [Dionaea muscipula]